MPLLPLQDGRDRHVEYLGESVHLTDVPTLRFFAKLFRQKLLDVHVRDFQSCHFFVFFESTLGGDVLTVHVTNALLACVLLILPHGVDAERLLSATFSEFVTSASLQAANLPCNLLLGWGRRGVGIGGYKPCTLLDLIRFCVLSISGVAVNTCLAYF